MMIKLRKRIQNQNDKNLSFTENKKKRYIKKDVASSLREKCLGYISLLF